MKGLLITFCLAVLLSTTLSAQPYMDYSVARTDSNYTPGPVVPGSVWGGSTGMGKKWCFSNDPVTGYNGICIWRLTDATVFPGGDAIQVPDTDAQSPATQTDDNQRDNISSILNNSVRYIIAKSTNGGSAIIKFDIAAPSATTQSSNLSADLMFDESNAGIIYARVNHTRIQKWTSIDCCWTSINTNPPDIYDLANCPGLQGYQPNWSGTWGTAIPTNTVLGMYHTWGTALSDQGQDNGQWALAYKEPVKLVPGGCASINTVTGQAWGFSGQSLTALDDGNGTALPSFKIHDGA